MQNFFVRRTIWRYLDFNKSKVNNFPHIIITCSSTLNFNFSTAAQIHSSFFTPKRNWRVPYEPPKCTQGKYTENLFTQTTLYDIDSKMQLAYR